MCCMTKVAVLYDSYSTASSFDPPTQNTVRSDNVCSGVRYRAANIYILLHESEWNMHGETFHKCAAIFS